MASIAYLQVRNMPLPSTSITRSQSSPVASVTSINGITPAFATSTSIRPDTSTAAWIMARASASSETSPTTLVTPSNETSPSALMSEATTVAPSSTNSSAVARPIPLAAPVTTQVLPERVMILKLATAPEHVIPPRGTDRTAA